MNYAPHQKKMVQRHFTTLFSFLFVRVFDVSL